MIVIWEVDDGYCGGSRPHETVIDDSEFEYCETEEERQEIIDDAVRNDFEQTISWFITRIEE